MDKKNKLFLRREIFLMIGILLMLYICITYMGKKLVFEVSILVGIFLLLFTIIVFLKKEKIRNSHIYILSLLGVSCILNIKVFTTTSTIDKNNYLYESRYSSLMEYFLTNYNEGTQISKTHYGLFADFMKIDMFEEKEVILSYQALSNLGINEYFDISEDKFNQTVKNILPISEEDEIELEQLYNPQIIEIKSLETNDILSKIYLVTGSVWINCERIYMLSSEGKNTWLIPSPLVKREYLKEGNDFYEVIGNDVKFTANLNFHKDGYIESLKNDDGSVSGEIKNFLFVCYFLVLGLAMLWRVKAVLGMKLYVVLSFPFGVSLFIVSSILGGLFQVPLNLVSISILCIGMLIVALALGRRFIKETESVKKEPLVGNLLIIACLLFIMTWFSYHRYTFLSYDSVCNILLGHQIANSGKIVNILSSLTSYSLFSPFVQMGAKFFNIQYAYSFQPIFNYIGVLSIIVMQQRILNNISVQKKYINNIISIIVVISYITIPVFRLNSIWILNNLPIGIFLGMAAQLIILHFQEEKKLYLYLSLIPFWMFSNLRIEGMLFAVLFLVSVRNMIKHKKDNKIYAGVIAISSLFIYILYYIYMGTNEDSIFWNPLKGGAMQLVIIGYYMYIILSDCSFWRKRRFSVIINTNLEYIMICFIIIATSVMAIVKSDLAINNIKILLESSFGRGYWGYIWVILFVILGLSIKANETEGSVIKFLETGIISFFLLLFLLMLFNKVYLHAGYGDSAHRMMLHVLPFAGVYISFKTALLSKGYQYEAIEVNIERRSWNVKEMKSFSNLMKSGCFVVLWGIFKYLPFPFVNYIRYIILKIFSNEIHSTYILDGITIHFPWNLSIGYKSSLNHNISIDGSGGVKIGNGVRIAANVSINTADYTFKNKGEWIMNQGYTVAGVVIQDDVWIGDGVKINKGITIGQGSVIGCGSVVTKNIPPYSIAVGVPCEVIDKR